MSQVPLYTKYRPKKFCDVVEQDAIKQILGEELKNNSVKRVLLFTGGAGTGKAQPLYSKILTPQGYVDMGSIQIGDTVYTHNGNLAHVTQIYPQGKRSIYEITLQDRTKIRVADNHLNYVYYYDERKKCKQYHVLTTLELLQKFEQKNKKWRIDVPRVNFCDQPVLIDPYLLGAFLGDGGLSKDNLNFSNSEQDIIDKLNFILKRDYNMYLKRKSLNTYDYDICYINNPKHNGSKGNKALHPLVRNYDPLQTLSGQLGYYDLRCKSILKHIPKQYLYNSYEVRLRLLQGLFDTDGEKGGRAFSTSSPQLAEDVAFLMRSLGIRVTVTRRAACYKGIKCRDSYSFYVKPPKNLKIFTSKKHIENYIEPQNEPIRNIVSIEYIGEEECQCIMVDHPDHTYISDDFIPTHNTTSARIFATELEKVQTNIFEMNCANYTGVDDIRELILQSTGSKPMTGSYKVYILDEVHMLTVQAQNALLKVLEEPPSYCIFILCTTDPQKILSTILSRTFRYDFQLISFQGIMNRLFYILEQEKQDPEGCGVQSWSNEAIAYIAQAAQGHMRNAIALLDKTISYSKNITVEDVVNVLGVTSFDKLFDTLDAIIEKNPEKLLETLDKVDKSGIDLKLFIKNFLSFTLEINKYIIQIENNSNNIMLSIPSTYGDRISNYRGVHKPILKHLLTTLLELNSSIKWETTVRPVLETSLLLEVV